MLHADNVRRPPSAGSVSAPEPAEWCGAAMDLLVDGRLGKSFGTQIPNPLGDRRGQPVRPLAVCWHPRP